MTRRGWGLEGDGTPTETAGRADGGPTGRRGGGLQRGKEAPYGAGSLWAVGDQRRGGDGGCVPLGTTCSQSLLHVEMSG